VDGHPLGRPGDDRSTGMPRLMMHDAEMEDRTFELFANDDQAPF
jgi:hypothetical protein